MRGVLSGHVVGEDMATRETALRGIGLIAERHAGAFHDDMGPAEAEATRTLIRGGWGVVKYFQANGRARLERKANGL